MALWILIWLALASAVAAYANERGRSAVGWLFFSIFFSPILGFVIVAATPNLKAEAEDRARDQSRSKTCPQCAETVKQAAKVCRHCGYQFPTGPATSGSGASESTEG
ncbi:MAG: zinc ribbon domain-containing protein [Alphaproteobacteria bacterium]|nr:zinc ribbon domain-containing protein [Alphaproteobacteria bacterium]